MSFLDIKENENELVIKSKEDLDNFLNSKIINLIQFLELKRKMKDADCHKLEFETEFNEGIKCKLKIEVEKI